MNDPWVRIVDYVCDKCGVGLREGKSPNDPIRPLSMVRNAAEEFVHGR